MRQEGHPQRGSLPTSNRVYMDAVAGGTVTPGMLLKASGNPFTVAQAGDGESVFGICCSQGGSGDTVRVIVQGRTSLKATAAASWASHRRVCAAASNEVDQGASNDPWFATLVYHDAATTEAVVDLHTDAMPAIARGVRDIDGMAYTFDSMTVDRPLIVRSGRIASERPIGSTANRPSSPYGGQFYYDTDIDSLITWDGAAWVYAQNHKGTSFPGSPVEGQRFYRTDHDAQYTYDGARWLGEPFTIDIRSLRGSAVSSFYPGPGNLASDDANAPIIFGRTVRILAISSGLRGGTGGRTWTTRLRLDGSGSDSFACTNTIVSSAGTWVLAAQEAVGLSLTATNRLNIYTNASGGSETYGYSGTLTVAFEAT